MPLAFRQLVERAAAGAGFPGFDPDSCLINRYEPGRETYLAP
jgi:alkylated DNA repair protein (DNA oxidative demethylase)